LPQSSRHAPRAVTRTRKRAECYRISGATVTADTAVAHRQS
jgi:hypothetical protein